WSSGCVLPRISSCCSTTMVRSCRTPACPSSRLPTSPCSTCCVPSRHGRAPRCTWSAGGRARAWSAGSADSRSGSMPTMASGRGPRERSHRRGPVQRAAAGRGDRSRRSRVEPRPDPYCERHGGAAPARRDRGGLPVAPMTDRAAGRPFQFWTRLTLTKLTGRRAVDLAELVEHLRAVPLSVVFHHTHPFLVQHQYLS